jgi:hypothetical protein
MKVASRCVFTLAALTGVCALAGCGGAGVDSGGLTTGDRHATQAALDTLAGTNVALQIVTTTKIVESTPAACRVQLVSRNPVTVHVYVFWIPWLGSEAYTWLDMRVTKDATQDSLRMGTAKPVLPGGLLTANGRSVDPYSQDTTLLSRYGPQQAKRNHAVLMAHAGDVFAKPGARCQVLTNGSLRLVPNP